jgi:hypothetical protein
MGFDDLEAAEQAHATDGDSESSEASQSSEDGRDSQNSQNRRSSGDGSDGSQRATEPETDRRTTTDPGTRGGSGSDATGDPSETPGFDFDEAKQSPLYARPSAWQAFEDALDLEVVRALREAGVRNEAKRELHDAALRVAAEHPDEIAEAVEEARRE